MSLGTLVFAGCQKWCCQVSSGYRFGDNNRIEDHERCSQFMMCNGLEYRSVASLLLVCAVWHVTWWGCVWLLCSVCYKHWLIFMESQGILSPPRDHSSGWVVTLGVSRAWCQEAGWLMSDVSRTLQSLCAVWCANPGCTRANIPPPYSIILRTPCERHVGLYTLSLIPFTKTFET